VNDGRAPHLLMDIHNESEVNLPSIHLSEIEGPSHGSTFNNNSKKA
jgi:NADH-quinone oxidoreductase subunit G